MGRREPPLTEEQRAERTIAALGRELEGIRVRMQRAEDEGDYAELVRCRERTAAIGAETDRLERMAKR